jgi:hypothetical protein
VGRGELGKTICCQREDSSMAVAAVTLADGECEK